MAKSFELSLVLDYVSSWSFTDGVRELFQNCLDESIQNEDSDWFFSYNKEEKKLLVGNTHSSLPIQSLLLGYSTKKTDNRTIGEHGDGYKAATIVFLRTGHSLTVYNYREKEYWTSRVVKSRRYGAEIVKFDVQKLGLFEAPANRDLTFEVGNVTESEWEDIVGSNLWLQDDLGEIMKSKRGTILLDEKYRGNIYVNGLFVKNIENIHYGYNFAPGVIKLDRDRHTVDTFDIYWQASYLLAQFSVDEINKICDAPDFQYIYSALTSMGTDRLETFQGVADGKYVDFVNTYGADHTPVTTTAMYKEKEQAGYKPVKVSSNDYKLITASQYYKPVVLPGMSLSKGENLMASLKEWFDMNCLACTAFEQNRFKDIYKKLNDYISELERS